MTHDAGFWDRIAEKYAKTPIADEASYQKKLAITRDHLTAQSEVLEFGCGTGSTALLHAPHVKHILATDISGGMLAIAREKAAAEGIDNVTFEQQDIAAFEAPAGSYDVVLALSILHLVEDKEAVIARVHDWLKPGGVFISSTACLGDMSFFFPLILPLMKMIGKAPMVAVFKESDLVDAMAAAGFSIEHQWRPGKNKAVFLVARKPA